jgi:hypothetical protein
MPLLFSDDFPSDNSVLWLTQVQYSILKSWAANTFQPKAPPATSPELLPDGLTRMALEACVGRAFWPGIEMSISIYNPANFFTDDPFRIQFPGGTIQPGFLTQSMSIPWQSDFFDCAQETNPAGTLLYWWPAQRPNQVSRTGFASVQEWDDGITGGKDMVVRWHKLGIVRTTDPSGNQTEIERTMP